MTVFRPDTSFPYLKIAREFGVDFQKMGLKIVEARYVGGARPKRFCLVVVAEGL